MQVCLKKLQSTFEKCQVPSQQLPYVNGGDGTYGSAFGLASAVSRGVDYRKWDFSPGAMLC